MSRKEFTLYRRNYAIIARDLGYSRETRYNIIKAKTPDEVSRHLEKARLALMN